MHWLGVGVKATQSHARTVATRVSCVKDLVEAMCCNRAVIDHAALAREAVGHAECQLTNDGFAKSQLKSHKSVLEGSLTLRAVVDGGSVQHLAPLMLMSILCPGEAGNMPLAVAVMREVL